MAPPRRACSSGYFPDAPVPLAWQVILSRRLCAARSISFCTKSCASAFMSPGIANALMLALWRCAEMSATGLGREAEHSPVDLLASHRQRGDVGRDNQNRDRRIQGAISVRATRNPRMKSRLAKVNLRRYADRSSAGEPPHELPRTTRKLQSPPPLTHAEPSAGAPS